MRILMVNKYLYPRAGAETYMLYVAEQLIKRGHTVAFFGMEHRENTTLGKCVTVPFLDFSDNNGFAQKTLSLGKAAVMTVLATSTKSFTKFVKTFKPDVIHAHNVYNQLSPSMFSQVRKSIPVLMTVHDYKPVCPNYSLFVDNERCTRCLKGNYLHCVKHRCCHKSLLASTAAALSSSLHRANGTYTKCYHHFIAPSPFMKERLIEGGFDPEKISVIENFSELPDAFSKPGKGLLFTGRLCVEKGVHLLLKAYSRLRVPRPILVIAGEGPLEEELKQWSIANNINDSIRWLGRITPAEVLGELEKCAVSIVPSVWNENCSMAIMESLAHGRPVITSTRGGNPNLIEDGINGEVFDCSSPAALTGKINRLLQSHDLLVAQGLAARKSAEKRFSADVHMDQLLNTYMKLIGDNNDKIS